jgi:hypothetical protein
VESICGRIPTIAPSLCKGSQPSKIGNCGFYGGDSLHSAYTSVIPQMGEHVALVRSATRPIPCSVLRSVPEGSILLGCAWQE